MLGENFVYFFTVQGFFIGIVFSILKSFSAESLLAYTLLITIFFYLFSHLIIAFYYRTAVGKISSFPKEMHERRLDILANEINKREKIIDNVIKIVDAAIQINSKDNEMKI